MTCILITGSSGLVGRALGPALEKRGFEVRGLDLRATGTEQGDVRDSASVAAALDGVSGVVHLAAVSRVVWGERDPAACWSTNVEGLSVLLDGARRRRTPPWFIFASSREVYGHAETLPVVEDAPLRPINAYGRSKLAGEQLVQASRNDGLRACVVRLSNVYGCTSDHADRVVPAFARGAAFGSVLRCEGSNHSFDFSHRDDVIRGVSALVDRLVAGADAPPPIQFVTGESTTLTDLAQMAVVLGGANSMIAEAPPRSYDVSRFYGSNARARELLGWMPRISLREGLARLIRDFRREHAQPVCAGGIQ